MRVGVLLLGGVQASPFEPDNWDGQHFTWGAAPFTAADNRTCFYFTWLLAWADGNATRPVPWSDRVAGSLGLACGSAPTGPFTVQEQVAFPFRRDNYDAAYIENAVLTSVPAHESSGP